MDEVSYGQSINFTGGVTSFADKGPAGRDRLLGACLALDGGVTVGLDYRDSFSASQQATRPAHPSASISDDRNGGGFSHRIEY